MASDLRILIESGIQFNQSQVQKAIEELKKNNKLNLQVNVSGSNLDSIIKDVDKLKNKEKELNDSRKKSTQFTREKEIESYYKTALDYIDKYNKGIIEATELQKRLGQMMKNPSGSNFWKFDALNSKQQNVMQGAYNKATQQIDNAKIKEANELYQKQLQLLNEEFSIQTKIEQAKADRYFSKGNDAQEKNVTIKEKEYQAQLKLNQQLQEENKLKLNNTGIVNQEKENELINRRKQLQSELNITIAQTQANMNLQNAKAEADLKDFQIRMNSQLSGFGDKTKWISGSTEALNKYRQMLSQVTAENGKWYRSELQADGSMKQVAVTAKQLRTEFIQVKSEINGSVTMMDRIVHSATNITRAFTTMFSSYRVGMELINQGKNAVSYINEMDKYLTNVQIITGKTKNEVSGLTNEYIRLGKSLGAVSNNVAEIAESFYRQGRTASETTKLIEATTQMSQLSGLGTTESTEYMTSIMNGFKMSVDEASNVVSKLVSVDNSAATSVSELSEALSKTSAVARSVGVDLDTLVGYIGTVSETTRQDAGSIGKMLAVMYGNVHNNYTFNC